MSITKEIKSLHRRNLPHIHPSEGSFFITYRLYGALPVEIAKELHKLKNIKPVILKDGFFEKYDNYLDSIETPIRYLSIPEIAEINKKALHYYDDKDYHLVCYCIMSTHIHVVFSLKENARDVSDIMHSIKRYTARESNKILKRTGKFWQDESYDRVMRNENEFRSVVEYVMNNPVKAKLVKNWEDWPHTYVNFEFV